MLAANICENEVARHPAIETPPSPSSGVTVDLREPSYCDGVLSTEKGGVVTAPNIRIQAKHLRYTRKLCGSKVDTEQCVWNLEGEGDLIVEFGEYVFIGEKLIYDFSTKEGTLYYGRTAVEPWFFGGEKFELKANGSYLIYNGYVTTSERDIPDWAIYSKLIQVDEEYYLRAKNVHFKVLNTTVFWIPSLKTNLSSIFDNPIRYRFRFGGHQGPRFGLTYELFNWNHWKTFLRFDYRLTRGPGIGIETRYRSADHKTEFQSINYLAKDSSLLDPHEKARYQFEGLFRKKINDDKTSILVTYDKISDRDLPSSYFDRDFDFDTAKKTQLQIRHEEKWGISNFYTHVRINSFQTVKEELPTFSVYLKPFSIKDTGVIFDNTANASYLKFEYSKHLLHARNYSSTRFKYFPTLYRPIIFDKYATMTPEVGMIAILYGDSPKNETKWLLLGKAGLNLQTQLYHSYTSVKHIIEPYANYRYYSSPTVSPHQHYIFDMSDGWTRLNYLSFGVRNSFYAKQSTPCTRQLFSADLYSFAFFDTKKIKQKIPRIYGKIDFFLAPALRQIIDTGWNIEHNQLDFFNFKTEWTVNEDFAISSEYRHRGAYWWRKVDRDNFFLDMYHNEKKLLHSHVSDKSDAFLLHCFYRFLPNWSLELSTRQGWNRRKEPRYLEFELDLLTTIQTAWHLRLSFQHQEKDKKVNRLAIYLDFGAARPSPP